MDKQTELMIRILLLPALLVFFSPDGRAQTEFNYDYTYVDHIRTVRFFPDGVQLGYPILELYSGAQLILTFDDMTNEVRNYVYTVQHCNADWQPSDLMENEYIDGFTEDYVDQFEFSYNTYVPFVQYNLAIPNADMGFTKSGNYILKVYDDEDERQLVLTRRFVVVEPIMRVFWNMARTGMVSKADTHQEIDFTVRHTGINVRNPMIEVSATVLQNFRWDNALYDLQPNFVRGEDLVFDFQDKIVFEAGKEFRFLDIRSFRYPSNNVATIEVLNTGVDITLLKDKKRVNQAYLEYNDLNGQYFIENQDIGDNDLAGDYAQVLFSLSSAGEYEEGEVYVFGALSEWQLKPQFRMVYNERVNAYVADIPLKQGYYDYYYAVTQPGSQRPEIEEMEGNWYETENSYTILVYFRPFGERYDRLVAAPVFSSRS